MVALAAVFLLGLAAGWLLRAAAPPTGDPAPEGRVVGSKTLHVVYYRAAGRIVPVSDGRILPEWVA